MEQHQKSVNILKSNELHSWLKAHKPKVAFEHEKTKRATNYYNFALQGLKNEKEPDLCLKQIMEFATPLQSKDVKAVKFSGESVENILQTKWNKDRYNAGVNLSTIMTEHRRKVILNALTGSNDIHETRDDSRRRLNVFLQPIDFKDTVPVSSSFKSGRVGGLQTNLEPCPPIQCVKYGPKWEHYSTMKSRWEYIQPQIKRLDRFEDIIVPLSCHRQLKIDDEVLCGSVADVVRHSSEADKKKYRCKNIGLHSSRLIDKEDERKSVVYVPSHSVRY